MGLISEVCAQHSSRVLASRFVPWEEFDGTTVLITGVTGLIGSQLARTLLELRRTRSIDVRIIGTARNLSAAKSQFGDYPRNSLSFVEWDLFTEFKVDVPVDFIVHTASPTASRYFVEQPAETIESIVHGGSTLLEYARSLDTRSCLFLSSMEVYGQAYGRLAEGDPGLVSPLRVRSSYPEAKRLVECLFVAYSHEYGLRTSIARLAQTFGQGVAASDTRVFAEFGRSARNSEDIVLLTSGEKCNPYVSVDDAVSALLCILLRGESGEAYNVANEQTFCSVRDMAEMVAREFGQGLITVSFELDDGRSARYPEASSLNLDCSKLCALGWQPNDALEDMYASMFEYWDACNGV